jgi:polyhydroxyalkanoate synthesis repressor PhaR
MPLIKRYPNRKLYDTEAKQYITLEGIAELIRQGKEIKVVDNASGEDLTAQTLTQVIAELEKQPGGFLPRTILAGLIQTGGERLSTLQRNLITTMGLWRHIDEEIRRRIRILVQQGELAEGEGQRLLERLLAISQPTQPSEPTQAREDLQQEVEKLLNERDVPSRADLERVVTQLQALSEKLDELGEGES